MNLPFKAPKGVLFTAFLLIAASVASSAGALFETGAPDNGGPKSWKGTFLLEQRYLLLPIHNGAPKPTLRLVADGEDIRFLSAELARTGEEVDWWAFLDLADYLGQQLTLEVSNLSEEGFALIRQDSRIPGEAAWGDEPRRPQFHFSQKVGWNNDPNGLVYLDGEWHLFFQHNPVGRKWGNMTWGHAVSTDLLHWEQLPHVLHHRRGDAMFSGGAAVDRLNTGGWKTGPQDVIVATWTSTGRGECVAYSNDRGRTFTEFKGNPVIQHKGRDPKPVWYAYGPGDKPLDATASNLGGHWVIAVYDEHPEYKRNIAFYTSTNLQDWALQSHLPGYYECAELFTLPVDGHADDTRWVVFAADARYATGRFDGRVFTPEHEGKHQLHHGAYYASQLFSNAPEGRRIQVGWAKIALQGTPFNQTFSFPTELSLRSTPEGVRLFGEPVREIRQIHGRTQSTADRVLKDGEAVQFETRGELFDIRATWQPGTAKQVGLRIGGKEAFVYDVKEQKARGKPCALTNASVSVQLLVDRPMMETFVNHGRMIFTEACQNDLNIESVAAWARGGDAVLLSFEVHELKPQPRRHP